MTHEVATLKNGSREVMPLVVTTMLCIESLMEERPLALYDLVMICRGEDYQPFGDNGEYLKSIRLMQPDGRVHESIKNVVLSAVTGDGLDMQLGSPVAPGDGGKEAAQ